MSIINRSTSKKIIALLFFCTLMMSPFAVQAATKNFTFSMTHQLSIGTYKSTKGSVTGKVDMKSWGREVTTTSPFMYMK